MLVVKHDLPKKTRKTPEIFEFCPLCMTETIGQITSIMYDTDYELPEKSQPKKKIAFLKEVKKWESFIPSLSKEEIEMKKKLGRKLKKACG